MAKKTIKNADNSGKKEMMGKSMSETLAKEISEEITVKKIKFLNEKRKEMKLSYEKLSEKTGIPLSTIRKIFAGYTKAPRYDNMVALEQVLIASPNGGKSYGWREDLFYEGMKASEEAFAYYGGETSEYTVQDIYKMDDGLKYELIDGHLYALAVPNLIHQVITSRISSKLSVFIDRNGGPCMVMGQGAAINPAQNDKDYLIPDISVVCDYSIFGPREMKSGPDLVVEVLSPTTRNKDLYVKVIKYREFGVKEYWIVDPDKEKIVVYIYDYEDNNGGVKTYTFSDEVPVGIFGGKLKIDFKEIKNVLKKIPSVR